jgi:hypothetical protein
MGISGWLCLLLGGVDEGGNDDWDFVQCLFM